MDRIQELEQRVKELEERNHYLEKVFDAIPVNMFVKNTDCKYCFTNRVCDTLNGVERGGLYGKTDFDLQQSEEIAKSFYDDDKAIMASKKGSRMLSPTLCGHDIKYYDIYKEPVLDDDGSVIGIFGMVIDPADSVIDNNRMGGGFKNDAGTSAEYEGFLFDYSIDQGIAIVLRNSEGLDFFGDGVSPEEALTAADRVFPEDRESVVGLFEDIRAGKGSQRVIRLYNKSGDMGWYSISLNAVMDRELRPVHAIGLIRPINEEDAAAEKIRIESERVNNNVASILGTRYDTFMYVNRSGGYYHILESKDSKAGQGSSGSIEELMAYCQKAVCGSDLKLLAEVIRQMSEEKDSTQNFRSIEFRYGNEDNFRWKEADFFRIDGSSGELLVTVFDVDDVVREKQTRKLKEINNGIIDILSTVVEFRSVESGDHINRIKGFTKILLRYVNEMMDDVNFDDETIEIISSASAMHDVGKIAIPDSILLKPGRLTKEEFDEMKKHTVKGCDIIRSMSALQEKSYYDYSYEICRYHHERFDGRGYPDGLKGDEIPIAAQIVSVADVYDALISKRCYKDAYSLEEAYNMILNGECGVFSPSLMECFKSARAEMEAFSKEAFSA